MTIEEIREEFTSDRYGFLRTDRHLKDRVILVGLGGSHAYGTDVETSDLDIRGCALNSKEEILTNRNFEQYVSGETDTTIYSFNKLISLLSNCNPNVIELLGLKPEHYLVLTDIGKELLDNRKLFLSKKAVHSFGGYANAQLRRLDNKAMRLVDQERQEAHILHSIESAESTFPEKYFRYDSDSIRLYTDRSEREDFETEIFMDVNLKHYPLRDYKCMWSEMQNIVKDYSKIGKRNQKAMEHGKLGKHMMHLVRLYLMCLDILEKGEIVTYREKEHDLLMDIRNGKYLDGDNQPVPEFFEMVDEFEKKMEYAKENTDLPDVPDYRRIEDFMVSVNERVVRGM